MSLVQLSTRLLFAVLSACSCMHVNGDKTCLDENQKHNVTVPVVTKSPIVTHTKSRLREYATDALPRHTFWTSGSSPYLEAVFHPFGWVEVNDPANAALVILRKKFESDYVAGEGTPFEYASEVPYLMNKVEGTRSLTDKANLHQNLASLPDGEGLYAQPRTFVIASDRECADFLARPMSNMTTWVKKDPHEAEGVGIEFYPPGSLSETWPCYSTELWEWEADDPTERIVLQAHIDHPFLVNKKKTEMRAYWLIANVDPLIVLFYNDGSVRMATSEYEDVALDPTNRLKHVLNTVQQKAYDPNYEETADERKCSWLEMAAELKRLGRIQVEPQAWIDNALLPAFQKIMRTCIDGARGELQSRNRLGRQSRRFEILGMDVILEDEVASNGTKRRGLESGGVPLDGGLRMWMTEVQLDPDLVMDSATKKAFIPPLLQEQLEIALEIDLRKHEGKTLSNLSSLKNFAVLIDESNEDVVEQGL